MEKIRWTDQVRNEEVLQRVKEERNILHTTKIRNADWIGHILHWNCFLKHITEGKIMGRIEVMGRRGRRRKQLLDDIKETRGYRKLKEGALDRTAWRTRFGCVCGPVVREATEFTNASDTRLRQTFWQKRNLRLKVTGGGFRLNLIHPILRQP